MKCRSRIMSEFMLIRLARIFPLARAALVRIKSRRMHDKSKQRFGRYTKQHLYHQDGNAGTGSVMGETANLYKARIAKVLALASIALTSIGGDMRGICSLETHVSTERHAKHPSSR